ncbi:MAG: ATP-binding protein [Bacteroidia bacterium]|nr:ATP-binding protein [Bacteroidia bacterium]
MAQNSIFKIAVVGAESTGKTWLCEELAKHYQTAWVPEYAREYFNDSDIYNYTLEDLETIARRQIQLEQEALKDARKFLFCDTTLVTLKIWAELEFKTVPAFIARNLSLQQYNYYFITSNEIPWESDPLRQNKHGRDLLFQMNKKEIIQSKIPYSVISGREEQRLRNAIKILNNAF